jgi:CRISPR-associated protein Csm1
MDFVNKISIAALLHDIGKFYQRTGLELKNSNNTSYCPTYNQSNSHIHSAYTAQFFDDFESKFSIFQGADENTDDNIINLAAYHHKPFTNHQHIITEADRLASGFDRTQYDEYNNYVSLSEQEQKQQERYDKARLLSPFSRLYIGKSAKDAKLEDFFYEIDELIPENIFPKSLKELDSNNLQNDKSSHKYLKLWDKFKADFDLLDFNQSLDNFNNFYQSLLYILERYTSFIPSSSYHTVADISLLDHSKVTAAIATALYKFQENSNIFDETSIKNREENKYLMVQGDFTGIQKFIFDRYGKSNKFAAKILRAKSLFVAAFTELSASYICGKAGVNNACILVNAGGKFVLLLPNNPKINNAVKEAEVNINDNFLYETTYSQTIFNITYLPVCGNDFKMGAFSKKMKELAESLELKKLKPAIKKEKYVFNKYLSEVSKEDGVCEICGIRPINTSKNTGEEEVGLCLFDKIAVENGKELVKNDFIIFKNDLFVKSIENSITGGKDKYDFIDFAKLNGSALSKKVDKNDVVYDVRGIYNENGTAFNFSGYAKKPYKAYVPVFKEGDHKNLKYDNLPKEDIKNDVSVGSLKLFNYIARDGRKIINEDGHEKSVGVSHLATLKGDIDNAGEIFINGFKKINEENNNIEDIYTISRFSMMSRMFDYFFGVWLPSMFLTKEFSSIYTVFAGGDDLFLIGPWNQIICLAELVSNKIKELGAHNNDVHISIGVALASPSVPVYQLADKAEDELEKCKKLDGKNAVTVFGKTLKWEEFYNVFDKKQYFAELLEDKNEDKANNKTLSKNNAVSIGYIYKILKFIEMNEKIENCKKNGGIHLNSLYENAKWRPLFRYITHRNYGDNKLLTEKLNFIPEYIEKFGNKLIIPISYAIYERRD